MKKLYNQPITNVACVCAQSYMCIPSISTQVDPVMKRMPGPFFK